MTALALALFVAGAPTAPCVPPENTARYELGKNPVRDDARFPLTFSFPGGLAGTLTLLTFSSGDDYFSVQWSVPAGMGSSPDTKEALDLAREPVCVRTGTVDGKPWSEDVLPLGRICSHFTWQNGIRWAVDANWKYEDGPEKGGQVTLTLSARQAMPSGPEPALEPEMKNKESEK